MQSESEPAYPNRSAKAQSWIYVQKQSDKQPPSSATAGSRPPKLRKLIVNYSPDSIGGGGQTLIANKPDAATNNQQQQSVTGTDADASEDDADLPEISVRDAGQFMSLLRQHVNGYNKQPTGSIRLGGSSGLTALARPDLSRLLRQEAAEVNQTTERVAVFWRFRADADRLDAATVRCLQETLSVSVVGATALLQLQESELLNPRTLAAALGNKDCPPQQHTADNVVFVCRAETGRKFSSGSVKVCASGVSVVLDKVSADVHSDGDESDCEDDYSATGTCIWMRIQLGHAVNDLHERQFAESTLLQQQAILLRTRTMTNQRRARLQSSQRRASAGDASANGAQPEQRPMQLLHANPYAALVDVEQSDAVAPLSVITDGLQGLCLGGRVICSPSDNKSSILSRRKSASSGYASSSPDSVEGDASSESSPKQSMVVRQALRHRSMSECWTNAPQPILKSILKRGSTCSVMSRDESLSSEATDGAASGGGRFGRTMSVDCATEYYVLPGGCPLDNADSVFSISDGTDGLDPLSASYGGLSYLQQQRRTVRFAERVQERRFRPQSSILAQKKKNMRKQRNKQRRHSTGSLSEDQDTEGDADDTSNNNNNNNDNNTNNSKDKDKQHKMSDAPQPQPPHQPLQRRLSNASSLQPPEIAVPATVVEDTVAEACEQAQLVFPVAPVAPAHFFMPPEPDDVVYEPPKQLVDPDAIIGNNQDEDDDGRNNDDEHEADASAHSSGNESTGSQSSTGSSGGKGKGKKSKRSRKGNNNNTNSGGGKAQPGGGNKTKADGGRQHTADSAFSSDGEDEWVQVRPRRKQQPRASHCASDESGIDVQLDVQAAH